MTALRDIPNTRAGDETILRMLDVIATRGGPDARERYGLTAGQVAVMRTRYIKPAPCACKKPENRDGGMPAGWWHT